MNKPYTPNKKPKKTLPVKTGYFLLISDPQGNVYLEQRPSNGIWGGLWSLPETDVTLQSQLPSVLQQANYTTRLWQEIRHTFSHFHLDMKVYHLELQQTPTHISDNTNQLWYNSQHKPRIGLAAPIKKLLQQWHTPTPQQELL